MTTPFAASMYQPAASQPLTPVQRGSGALLGLAFAEAWAGQPQRTVPAQRATQAAHAGEPLLRDGSWGEVMLANVALGSALLAQPSLSLLDLLRRYQHQDGRRLLDPFAGQASWPTPAGRAPQGNPGLQVPLLLQLLPLVLCGAAREELPVLLQARLAVEPQAELLAPAILDIAAVLQQMLLGEMGDSLALQQTCLRAVCIDGLSGDVARRSGLADWALVVQTLTQHEAIAGLQQVWQQAQAPYLACCLYGMLAGIWHGESFWPVIGMYRLPGGMEIKDLAWMLASGLSAAEWLQALRCLALDDADHQALRPYNRLLQLLPDVAACDVPLRSALGGQASLQTLLQDYRTVTLQGDSAMAMAQISVLLARLMHYAQWLNWPLGWPRKQIEFEQPEQCMAVE